MKSIIKILLQNEKGFTFVETILYVSIFVLMMTTIIPFAWTFVDTGTKSATQQEVFSNARYISQIILYTIRNASSITSVSSTSATFATDNPSTNPTIIDLSAGVIRIKQGVGSVLAVNSSDTSVSALLFTNYSSADLRTKHIEFSFTVNGHYLSQRQEYMESTSVSSSAELRSN